MSLKSLTKKLLKIKKSSPPRFNVNQRRFVRPKREVKRKSCGFFD